MMIEMSKVEAVEVLTALDMRFDITNDTLFEDIPELYVHYGEKSVVDHDRANEIRNELAKKVDALLANQNTTAKVRAALQES